MVRAGTAPREQKVMVLLGEVPVSKETRMYIINVALSGQYCIVSICKKKSCPILSSRLYLYSKLMVL